MGTYDAQTISNSLVDDVDADMLRHMEHGGTRTCTRTQQLGHACRLLAGWEGVFSIADVLILAFYDRIMPELVEVEHFRQLLMPLVGARSGSELLIETPSPTKPKGFPSEAEWDELKEYSVKDVLRKGKLLRIELECQGRDDKHLYLHMGMTGRISCPGRVLKLESLKGGNVYPPPHTHLILKSNKHEVAFSDPRRFGRVVLRSATDDEFSELAPDALAEKADFDGIVENTTAIKKLLLDQKRVVSGVGNWICDEVLYQAEIHPDQTMLTSSERDVIVENLNFILETAVSRMEDELPADWLFHRRWDKRKGIGVKDAKGRPIKWITSAGRTSAICPSIQMLKPRKQAAKRKTLAKSRNAKSTEETEKTGNQRKKRSKTN